MSQGNPPALLVDDDPALPRALESTRLDRRDERRMPFAGVRNFPLLLLLGAALLVGGWFVHEGPAATGQPVIRVGCEEDFSPYTFVNAQGQPAGFGVDLIEAVAEKMGLTIEWSTGSWDTRWNALVSGQLDALPIVAKTPGRVGLVDFSLAHTETFEAFFVREGNPPIPDLAAAQGKSIVTMRSDASHHQLLEHHFKGNLVLVDSIPEGLALVSSGRHDAYLGPLLICTLTIEKQDIRGLVAGNPIPDYKRVFSFGVKKGADELREKLNQGLLIVKTNGEYDRIYRKRLTIEDPVLRYRTLLLAAIPAAIALILMAGVVLGVRRGIILRRSAELSKHNKQLELEISERKQTEEALEKTKALLNETGRMARIGGWELDARTLEVVWTEETYAIHEVDIGESPPLEKAIGFSHPEDRPKLAAAIQKALDRGEPYDMEVRLITAKGRHLWTRTACKPVMVDGQVIRLTGIFQDITERRRAEEALRENETMLRHILDSVPQSIFWKDVNSVFLGCNQAFARACGLSGPEQIVGKTDYDLPWPKAEADAYRADDADVIARKTPKMHILKPLQVAAGGRLWIDTSKMPLLDARQDVRGVLGGYEDITERKRAVDALRRRLEMEQVLAGVSGQLIGLRFEKIENDLPPLLAIIAQAIGADMGGMCSFGVDGATCLSAWSAAGAPAAEGLFPQGAEAQAWLLSRLRNFESFVIRRAEDLPPEAEAERRCFAESGIQSLLTVPLMKADALTGSLVFTTVRAPRDWSPEDVSLVESFARILATGIEAARLERALHYNERRYLDLIENLSEGLWSVGEDLKTTFVNKRMAEMLGYAPDEILGKDPRTFMTGEGARVFDERLKERLQGKSGKYASEYIHRDGHRVFASISGAPVRDEQGNITGSMALVSDLSKERLLQLQLVQAQRLEAIGQLAAGIAHEINTPTQYVDNNTQFLRGAFEYLLAVFREFDVLLREAREVPALADVVQRVEAARAERRTDSLLAEIPGAFDDVCDGLKRISLIVDSVKRFAHPGQEAFQPADINDALRSTIVVTSNEWKYVAEMVTDLDPGLPPVPCVLADINQVVLNLIVNAAHAIDAAPGRAPDAKGVITVRTRVEDGWAIIEVQDTGPGIPLEIRPRIFDPFFTTKEVGKGTGQGLAIARTVVVEKHGGSIHFETEEGRGTTFFVRLPLTKPRG